MRWLSRTGAVVSAAIAAWFWWGRRSIEAESIPWMVIGGVVGLAAAVVAAVSLRSASTPVRIGQVLIGLGGLATGGWNLFVAWMVAIFPPC
jgi:hypothetical protein